MSKIRFSLVSATTDTEGHLKKAVIRRLYNDGVGEVNDIHAIMQTLATLWETGVNEQQRGFPYRLPAKLS